MNAKVEMLLDVVSNWGGLLHCRPGTRDWEHFKAHSLYPVEQETFPPVLPEWTGGKYPCTDGATVWIPEGPEAVMIALFLHETAHAMLHYPNGPDGDLWDATPDKYASVIEAEACAVAYLAAKSLGVEALHNREYLLLWRGDVKAFETGSRERVLVAARKLIDRFTGVEEAA